MQAFLIQNDSIVLSAIFQVQSFLIQNDSMVLGAIFQVHELEKTASLAVLFQVEISEYSNYFFIN